MFFVQFSDASGYTKRLKKDFCGLYEAREYLRKMRGVITPGRGEAYITTYKPNSYAVEVDGFWCKLSIMLAE